MSASAWLSGKGPASAANSWPSARRSRGACAVWAMSHTRASRNLDFGFEVRGERQARVPVAAPAILSFSMRVLCVFIDLLRSPSRRRDGVDKHGFYAWLSEKRRQIPPPLLQSFYYIYYLQKWGLHNRSQIPSDSENRRQIGGYIIAPKSHLTAKKEGR